MCPSYPQNKYKNRGPVKNKLIQSDLAAPEISYSVIKLQFLGAKAPLGIAMVRK